ncbi:MAG: O-succinylbenzoate-CoA ligase [Bacteroidia bacterium]
MTAVMFQRLDDFLDYHARVHGEIVFVTEGARALTFAQSRLRVDQIAGRLSSSGLVKGDRIALLGKNSIEFFFMVLACARLGVVPVGINYRLTPGESALIIADATANFLFADADLIEEVAQACPNINAVCLYGEHALFEPFAAWLELEAQVYNRAQVTADDVMSQMYTSGTTGLPKGVLLSHANIMHNVHQTSLGSEYTFSAGDEFLLVAPMYHAAGIMIAYTGLMQGLTLVIHREYDASKVVQTLASRPIAAVTLVPAMLQMIVDSVPDLDDMRFPYLQLIYYGASPIAVPLLRLAIAVFDCDFTQGYGQTETNSIVAMLSASDHRKALDGHPELLEACGRAAFNTQLRVIDTAGRQLAMGEAGEIVARGPQVMLGYWNNPEATRDALRDGWLHTGDIGCFDEEGYLRIVGRLKDMIISGGENIYPVEIENILTLHPAVADAAVIGVADAKWGEVPLAILVNDAEQVPSNDELTKLCREHLAGYKVPAHFHFMSELPRNPSGKVLKQQLRHDIGKHYEQ